VRIAPVPRVSIILSNSRPNSSKKRAGKHYDGMGFYQTSELTSRTVPCLFRLLARLANRSYSPSHFRLLVSPPPSTPSHRTTTSSKGRRCDALAASCRTRMILRATPFPILCSRRTLGSLRPVDRCLRRANLSALSAMQPRAVPVPVSVPLYAYSESARQWSVIDPASSNGELEGGPSKEGGPVVAMAVDVDVETCERDPGAANYTIHVHATLC